MSMRVQILSEPFDPWASLQYFQDKQLGGRGDYGATASFVGSMRDINQGEGIRAMTLEHYPGMTERHLENIIEEAKARWQLIDCLIVHRVGTLKPREPIVLTAVWSAHRKDAFEACRYLMEELKSRAPFWKHETLKDGEQRWVQGNTPGY